MSWTPPPEPVEVRHETGPRRLTVSWDDGHVSSYGYDYLRSWCPCASCQGHRPDTRTDLLTELRTLAARTERHHRVRVEVVVIEDPGVVGERLDALVGATTEALSNAVKHASPSVVTLCVDAGDDGRGCLVTVTDDGAGMEVDDAPAGTGLARSIRGRLSEVGGQVTIRSTVGRGTEVSLWVP